MPQFMLLLHNAPRDDSKVSPADMQAIIQQFTEWSQKLAAAGKLRGGQKLTDDGGRMITAKGGGISVTDGPYAEAKEVIGGFFLVDAESYDDAVKLSRDCPVFKFGGRIELRQIDVM